VLARLVHLNVSVSAYLIVTRIKNILLLLGSKKARYVLLILDKLNSLHDGFDVSSCGLPRLETKKYNLSTTFPATLSSTLRQPLRSQNFAFVAQNAATSTRT
jgi:hypothetical protein